MNEHEFKKRLEELAVVENIKPISISGQRVEDTVEVMFDDQKIFLNMKFNPSLGIKITDFKNNVKPCVLGCGQSIANQTIEIKILDNPIVTRRYRCENCKLFLHPNGKKFIKTRSEFRESLSRYISNKNNK